MMRALSRASLWRLVASGLAVGVLNLPLARLFPPRLQPWTTFGVGLAMVVGAAVLSSLSGVRGGDIRWGIRMLLVPSAAYGVWLPFRHVEGVPTGSEILVLIGWQLFLFAAKFPLLVISAALVGPAVMRLARQLPPRGAVLLAAGAGAAAAVAGSIGFSLLMAVAPTTPGPRSAETLFQNLPLFPLLYPAGFAALAWLASRRAAREKETESDRRRPTERLRALPQ